MVFFFVIGVIFTVIAGLCLIFGSVIFIPRLIDWIKDINKVIDRYDGLERKVIEFERIIMKMRKE